MEGAAIEVAAREPRGLARVRALGLRRLGAVIGLASALSWGCSKGRAPADCRDDMVNINTGTATQLASLKGIGPERAADIIAHRARHGRFEKVAHVKQVKGIGEKTYERLRHRLTVTCETAR